MSAVVAPAGAAEGLKAWRNCQAACALAGFRGDLIEGDDGRPLLVVSRWALTRSFSNVADVEQWLAQVAGRASVHQGG